LYELGQGMHTLMDATSPSHKGWQTWYGAYWDISVGVKHYTDGASHLVHEMMPDDGVGEAVFIIRSFYLNSVKLKDKK